MSNFIKKALNYLVYIIIGNVTYGVVLYFVVTELATQSLLLAYIVNIVFILLVLALDEFLLRKASLPEKIYAKLIKLKRAKDIELNVRMYRWSLRYFTSFKSFLFVFYIAVLIFSQIIRFDPTLAGKELTDFINIIDYSVLILVAFTDFKEQFSRDKRRTRTRLEEFDQYLKEHPIL